MVRINWTKLAVEDLKSISDYISRDSLRYAKIQVLRLKGRTSALNDNPRLGRFVPELENEKRIDILTVHHSA